MLRNYFKIAWRTIRKHPFFSVVNIVGLSAGIAFTMLIAAYVWSEMRVNRTLKNSTNQYIIQSKWKDPEMGMELTAPGQLAKSLKENYPTLVANYYRWDGITSVVSVADKSFREGLQIGDSTFLSMYGFELLHGDATTAFKDPFSVVITAEKARKYFGTTDVIGKSLSVASFKGEKHDFKITAILKSIPRNSVTYITDDNNNELYFSDHELDYFGRNMSWNNQFIVNYIELRDGVTPTDLVAPMQHLLKQHASEYFASNLTPYLVPLQQYHLSAFNGLVKKMIYALSAIAIFILLMAVINFINLSVSRSTTRMREIGIRKVLGGLKKQLVLQFLIESILLVLFATLVAIVIYLLTRDLFGAMVGREIPQLTVFPISFALLPILFSIVVGTIAGLYPALVLTAMKSVASLKGKLANVKEKVLLRKSLVAFQFGIATIVFVGAIVISKQVNHFFSNDLGYNKDFLVSVPAPRNWSKEGVTHMANLRNEFARMPEVSNVSISFEVPNGNNGGNSFIYPSTKDSTTAINADFLQTDEYYAATFGIPMLAGKYFADAGHMTDSSAVVINGVAANALGFANASDAIGKQIRVAQNDGLFTIAGVTSDFHFSSMQNAIRPTLIGHVGVTTIYRQFTFKLKGNNLSQSLNELEKKWAALMPGMPFDYVFMDDTLKKLYSNELKLKQAAYTATVLSIIIVLLGVLGLVALSVQKRTKEIGIRKVLGASLASIITLFMKEFLLVIAIAGVVACPIAWYVMNGWLNDYTYRISLGAMPFITAIAGLGVITAVLIVLQTMKAGLDNPTKSLRTE